MNENVNDAQLVRHFFVTFYDEVYMVENDWSKVYRCKHSGRLNELEDALTSWVVLLAYRHMYIYSHIFSWDSPPFYSTS